MKNAIIAISLIFSVVASIIGVVAINANSDTFGRSFNVSTSYFENGIIEGGKVMSMASSTLIARDMCDASVILYTPTATSSLALPAASDFNKYCLLKNGDKKTVLFKNSFATAGNGTLTFIEGTGLDLEKPNATGAAYTVGFGQSAILTFTRISSSVVNVSAITLTD